MAKWLAGWLFTVLLMLNSEKSHADEENLLALNIALEMTPFFSFEEDYPSGLFCYLANQALSKSDTAYFVSKASKLSPALKFTSINNAKQSQQCQFIFLDNNDVLFVQKMLPYLNKQSLIIGTSQEVIYQSGHIALVKMVDRLTINMNKKNLLNANIKPSPQLLNISKILIE